MGHRARPIIGGQINDNIIGGGGDVLDLYSLEQPSLLCG